LAARVVPALQERGLTLAVAESLTGGLVMATLTEIPGASGVLRGGPVVYATDTKTSELDVDAELLASRGPVDPGVAEAMASGVRARWQADLGLATTGVAGPERQAGHPVGEVYVAVADSDGALVVPCDLGEAGSREAIRLQAVTRALETLLGRLEGRALSGEASGG
jgi:PncC family amidohydrolase